MTLRIAVVGAGLAGLSCAHALTAEGAEVTVFDKGREVGGRLTTRHLPPHVFDLGAQYFTAREAGFVAAVQGWSDAKLCAPWNGRLVAFDGDGDIQRVDPLTRFVGTPDMTAIARHLARDLDVRCGHRVERIESRDGRRVLRGTAAAPGITLAPFRGEAPAEQSFGEYDAVAVCLPAPQAALLLAPVSARLHAVASAVELDPCIAVGLVASEPDERVLRAVAFDGAFVGRESSPSSSALSWIARDSSKPDRPAGERWVLHASAAWSRRSWGAPASEVIGALLRELSVLLEIPPLSPTLTAIQPWLLARAPRPLDVGALLDEASGLGLAGDWVCGGRVEGACRSGQQLAAELRNFCR